MAEVDKTTDGDIMGSRLHEGLEYFLWKMSLPNTPSYNINTDIKFSVRLWFHNGIGNIFFNPFLVLNENEYGNFTRNYELKEHSHRGLQFTDINDGEGIELGDMCFDLTPFVQSITLPNIGASAETKVETLLGSMQVGSFSPYSSDGGQEITFTLLDTQYSILDAIFYPWLKMIGNPRWYDPNNAYTGHSTPYPICTIEIDTPMRWAPEPGGTQENKLLTPYVYQYIGARPKNYTIPEINAESRSSLTRTLTMVCDLVIVDMNKDSFRNKIKKENESIAATSEGYLPAPAAPAPTSPITPTAPDSVPENTPAPGQPDVDAAKKDMENAQKDKDGAQDAANQQAAGGEPGANNAEGPADPGAATPPAPGGGDGGGDAGPGGGGDQGGGDQGGGDQGGEGEGGDGGEGGGTPPEGGGAGPDAGPDATPSPPQVDSANMNDPTALASQNIQNTLNSLLNASPPDSGSGEGGGGGNNGGNNPNTTPGGEGGGGEGGGGANPNVNSGDGGGSGTGGGTGTNPLVNPGDGSGGGDAGGGQGGSGTATNPLVNPSEGGGGNGDGGGSSGGGTNPLTTVSMMARSGLPFRGTDKSLWVCSSIKVANDERHSMIEGALACVDKHGSDYVKSGVAGSMRDEIPQQFNSLAVGSLIDCVGNPSSAVDLTDRLSGSVGSRAPVTCHQYDYRLCDAKAIGNIVVEVQPELRDDDVVGNYGRVVTMTETKKRVKDKLPDFRTNVAQSFFALKSFQALDRFPNSSLSMHSEPDTDMWIVAAYLTPLHNSLCLTMNLTDEAAQPLPADNYPFIFRHSWFALNYFASEGVGKDVVKRKLTQEQEFAILQDALTLCEKERKEMQLGKDEHGNSCSLESVSLWEITDENLNHTGTYWCKAWLVRKNAAGEILSGNIVICKLNYMGSVLTDSFEFNGEVMREISGGIVVSKDSFTKETTTGIYSQNDELEVKKGGQLEEHFNPLTAITSSKRFSLTREYEEIAGSRDDEQHSNLRPTDYVHIEEWPVEGDEEAAVDDQGFYTLSSMDEEGALTQWHYKLEAKSSYEAHKILDDETQTVVPLPFGVRLGNFHTESGKYGWLAIKRHNCWSGRESQGKPYPIIHTTNSDDDMFYQYIPEDVEYVAQYRHHKLRWNTAKAEQAKFKQMIARASSRMVELSRNMKAAKDFVAEKITEEKVNALMKAISRMEEISKAYNILINLEIKQEDSLRELQDRHTTLSSKYRTFPYSQLPEKLSLADSVHLHTLSMSRLEDELSSIRSKQRELEAEYENAKRAKEAAINEISSDVDGIYEIITSCMFSNWIISVLGLGHAFAFEYFKKKEDRRQMMERLIVFFDHRIAKIEEALIDDPGNVSLADVILSCDWKAFGDWTTDDSEEIRKIRETANALGYRLRVKRLIPTLNKKLEKAVKKYEKLMDQMQDSTRLVYEPDYAYPGFVPKDDSDEQSPTRPPMDEEGEKRRKEIEGAKAKALNIIVSEYKSLFTASPEQPPRASRRSMQVKKPDPLSTIIAEYKTLMTARGSHVSGKKAVNIDHLDKVINEYKALFKSRGTGDGEVKTEELDYLDKVISEYKSLFTSRGASPTKGNEPAFDPLKLIIAEYKLLHNADRRSVSIVEIPKKPEEMKHELLEVYRELEDSFSNYSETDLENSLLLVLASLYLNFDEEGMLFKKKIVESRLAIERTKKAIEAYKTESSKELDLISAAKDKSSKVKESIEKLDKENLSMLRKFGSGNLPKDEHAQFRLNTLKKADMQRNLDATENVLHEMLEHYEQNTSKALSSYAKGLELARSSYDKLMQVLRERIDFDAKIESLYEAIFG